MPDQERTVPEVPAWTTWKGQYRKIVHCCAMPHLLACVTIALRDRATAVQVLSVGCALFLPLWRYLLSLHISCMCVARNCHEFGVSAFLTQVFCARVVVMVPGNSQISHLFQFIAACRWHVHWHHDGRSICEDDSIDTRNFGTPLESVDDVSRTGFWVASRRIPITVSGFSSASATRACLVRIKVRPALSPKGSQGKTRGSRACF